MLETPSVFFRTCSDWGITVLDLPTAYWHELAAALSRDGTKIPAGLRLVIIGGEKALPERLTQWLSAADSGARLLNGYGPTEATIAAIFCELGPESGGARAVPIAPPF